MSDFVLMTDSSCDLPASLADSLGVTVVPLSVTVEETDTYKNYLDHREIPIKAFYDLLREGKRAVTAAPSVGDFAAAMEPHLQAGKDVLYLGFSSALSAAYQNGAIAMNDLREKYPDRKLIAVDTCAPLWGRACWSITPGRNRKRAVPSRRSPPLRRRPGPICATGSPSTI
jgi:Uncharacterized protein conserved in bacteria